MSSGRRSYEENIFDPSHLTPANKFNKGSQQRNNYNEQNNSSGKQRNRYANDYRRDDYRDNRNHRNSNYRDDIRDDSKHRGSSNCRDDCIFRSSHRDEGRYRDNSYRNEDDNDNYSFNRENNDDSYSFYRDNDNYYSYFRDDNDHIGSRNRNRNSSSDDIQKFNDDNYMKDDYNDYVRNNNFRINNYSNYQNTYSDNNKYNNNDNNIKTDKRDNNIMYNRNDQGYDNNNHLDFYNSESFREQQKREKLKRRDNDAQKKDYFSKRDDFEYRNGHSIIEQSYKQSTYFNNGRIPYGQMYDREHHNKNDKKKDEEFEEKNWGNLGRDNLYQPIFISKELIQPINYIPPMLPRNTENKGYSFIYVESDKYPVSKSMFKLKMDDQGVLSRIAILSYNSLFAEYETHTMAEQMINKYQILSKFYPEFENCHVKLTSEEEINPKIQERINQEDTVFPNERCFVVHNIDFTDKIFLNLVYPIYQDSFKPDEVKYEYNRNERTLTTYHTKQSTITDLYVAFNGGKSGIPDTFVRENVNAIKLKEEVLKILTKKLVDACVNDCSRCLIPDTILFAIRKERINVAKARNSHGDSDRLINFYQSVVPMTFFISPLVHDAIKLKDKVKSESRKRKREMIINDAVGYQKKLIQRMKEEEDIDIFKKIKQPKLENFSSRLTPIHKIDENIKRNYLRPYAKSRLRPFLESSEGYIFHKTQFPVHIKNNLHKSLGAKPYSLITGNHLYFDKSTIQGWGLFTLEAIKKGSLICEYTGELIRTAVADLREEKYDKSGLQMYLFRVDKEYIIDATLCGGLARFLNHSCNPNCKSKDTVSIGNTKTISFFAIKDIKPHEEITFNYKMEHEEDETKWERCYCGSKHCSGYLNGPKNPHTNRFKYSDDDY